MAGGEAGRTEVAAEGYTVAVGAADVREIGTAEAAAAREQTRS